jgi:ParB-like chromosome segregation protein Spo0J
MTGEKFDGQCTGYEYHPISEILPMLPPDELQALADDIKENGQKNPIWLCDDKILDGRNRYQACELAGVEPDFVAYEGSDPLGHVISHNLRQRHLSASQRAMIAAHLANMKQGARTDLTAIAAMSQADVAKMLNVSVDSIQRAKKVREKAVLELSKAVEADKVSVSAAVGALDWTEAEQRDLAANGAERRGHAPGSFSGAKTKRSGKSNNIVVGGTGARRRGKVATGNEMYPYERAANNILALKENEQVAALELAAKGLERRVITIEAFNALQRAEQLSRRQATPDGMADTFKPLTNEDQDALIKTLNEICSARQRQIADEGDGIEAPNCPRKNYGVSGAANPPE